MASQRSDGLDVIETLELPGVGPCPLVTVPGAAPWQGRRTPPRFPQPGEDGDTVLDGVEKALCRLKESEKPQKAQHHEP